MASKDITCYIETNNDGKPCTSINKLTYELFEGLRDSVRYEPGLNPYSGKGRRKIKITLTIEVVNSKE